MVFGILLGLKAAVAFAIFALNKKRVGAHKRKPVCPKRKLRALERVRRLLLR